MTWLLRCARTVDRLNGWLGRAVAWMALVMILVGAFNAIARYLGRFLGRDLSANTYIELQWYLFSAVFLLGAAHTLKRDQHVRVDVLYGRLSARGKAWVDLGGTLLFLVPFCLFMMWVAGPYVASSIEVREGSPDPGGLARYPIKALIPVSFGLLLLQGLAEAVRRAAFLAGREETA